MENRKRLVRSSSDRWVAGILGGIAAYMGWDTALLRIAYLLLTLCSVGFPGFIVSCGFACHKIQTNKYKQA